MKNHMIIGLGGTGGKIIRAFRKAIYQEYRRDRPDGIHIAYLYVDSSGELMDLNDPSWKVLGHSVQLGQNSQLKIGGADLHSVLDNIGNFPGIRPWIGDSKQWKDILNTIVGETLGGQKRRLGRFLFAHQVEEFNDRVRHLIRNLEEESGTVPTTFHICCGLAGGTGSGSLIDAIVQIRNLGFKDPKNYRIILYTLLADENPPRNWDTGNYHANGYAALAELNALSVGRLKPHDLTGKKDRISISDPFNGCYIFTNRNENGMTVDVEKVIPEVAADFMYQKIVAVKNVEDWPQSLGRMENAENGDGTPETAGGTGIPERSKRFLTFGIKRLAVPEEEILEYMTYSFTSQASLQLLYNNWQDGLGFQDEPQSVDFKEFVQQKEILSRWKMTDAHICLSLGILEADAGNKKWKPVLDEWQNFVTESKRLIRDSVEKKKWLDELEHLCEKRYSENYRTLGVVKFYETKRKARREMATEICRQIQTDLFDDWRTGAKSMHEVSRLLEDLVLFTDDRIKDTDEQKSRLDTRETNANRNIKKNKEAWAKIGIFDKMFGKPDNIFNSQAGYLQELYVCRTWKSGWDFGRKLLEELKEALTDLKAEADECFSRIRKANDMFREKIDSRCTDKEDGDLKQHMIRYYSPETVKRICNRFVREESVQNSQTGTVRSHLVGLLGEIPGFAAFNKNMSIMRLMDTLETECEKSVKRTHELMIHDARDKLLGVNIIERLKNRYGANTQELRTYIADLVKYAGNYISFSNLEKGKQGKGIPVSPNCLTEFTVILPKAAEHSDFMEVLKQTFKESRTDSVNLIETESKSNEITLISITNLFPLRFLSPLANLEEKYDQRCKDLGDERAALEIHIEGNMGKIPRLFGKDTGTIVKDAIPWFLLAKSMDIIVERKHDTTGKTVLSMITKDEDGFDNDPVDLGEDLVRVPENLDEERASQIQTEVETRLRQVEYRHVDRQKEIIAAMNTEIEELKAELGMDNPVYRQFLTGAKAAAKIVKTEN